MFDYFRDTINPRGAEYGATARAAKAAQRNALAAEDLLELQLASSDTERARVAERIRDRRTRAASWRRVWRTIELSACAALVGTVVWYMATPQGEAPASALNADTSADVSRVTLSAPAPVNAARALDDTGSAPAVNASTNDPASEWTPEQRRSVENACLAAGLEKDCDGR